ncbi:hypothetical protein M2440_003321 [Methylorubrum extorquens]|nr:hypothetical protein [Methylorubrum extorquens]
MSASAALADGPAPDASAWAADDPAARMRRWTEGYAPRPGLADELVDAGGNLRGGWPRFLERVSPGSTTARSPPASSPPSGISATRASPTGSTATGASIPGRWARYRSSSTPPTGRNCRPGSSSAPA